MHKLLYAITAVFLFTAAACENTKNQEPSNAETVQSASLESSILDLKLYAEAQNKRSEGAFFTYMESNPDYTFDELVKRGFLNEDEIKPYMLAISRDMEGQSDQAIFNAASKIFGPENIMEKKPGKKKPKWKIKIKIWKCTGCLDGIPKNACHEIFGYPVGPGC